MHPLRRSGREPRRPHLCRGRGARALLLEGALGTQGGLLRPLALRRGEGRRAGRRAEAEEDAYPEGEHPFALRDAGGRERVHAREAHLQPEAATDGVHSGFAASAQPGRPQGAGGDGRSTQGLEVQRPLAREARHRVGGQLPRSGGGGRGQQAQPRPEPLACFRQAPQAHAVRGARRPRAPQRGAPGDPRPHHGPHRARLVRGLCPGRGQGHQQQEADSRMQQNPPRNHASLLLARRREG